MTQSNKDIWILAGHSGDALRDSAFGLVKEAEDIISRSGGSGSITAVIMGTPEREATDALKEINIDRILHIKHEKLNRYNGELFSRVFYDAVKEQDISCILLAHDEGASDFPARLAAMMDTALVSKAADFRWDERGKWLALRPVSGGYLFEELAVEADKPVIVTYLPSVLSSAGDSGQGKNTGIKEIIPEIDEHSLRTRVTGIIAAEPGELDIADADIVVAGGRGAGKGDDFNIIHELAEEIGGSVGGTRPVIDTGLLPFERQIGQTGKTVSPGLIINCGISGANEYIAGMEKSVNVISVNKDPRAGIFRLSDLGAAGDLKEIIPLLIEKIREIKKQGSGIQETGDSSGKQEA